MSRKARHWIVFLGLEIRVPRRVQRWWEFAPWSTKTQSDYNGADHRVRF